MKKHPFSSPIAWELTDKTLKKSNVTIGVLAIQGDFLEHILTLKSLGIATKEIRLPKDLENIDGLIMPGGESTTMARLLDVFKMREPLQKKIQEGLPVWGTCAGMILLAKKLTQDKPIPLGLMDIEVNRNAFGRQIDSFEANLQIKPLGQRPLKATFIRAPWIVNAGADVEILSALDGGQIVAAKEGFKIVTSFHPELTNDTRMHEYFISIVKSQKN